jgi:hypothetical protein
MMEKSITASLYKALGSVKKKASAQPEVRYIAQCILFCIRLYTPLFIVQSTAPTRVRLDEILHYKFQLKAIWYSAKKIVSSYELLI